MSLVAESETPNTQSSQALGIILSNIDMAVDDESPICQDTGMPTFVVHTPVGVNQLRIRKAIREAVAGGPRGGGTPPQFRHLPPPRHPPRKPRPPTPPL